MKLSNYREDYYEFTAKASDVTRSLAFAGIAVIWIFNPASATTLPLPKPLFLPLGLFALSLGFDLLQYCVASIIWGAFHRLNERKLDNKNSDPDLDAPAKLTWPQNAFFGLKILSVIIGYVFLIFYIAQSWLN